MDSSANIAAIDSKIINENCVAADSEIDNKNCVTTDLEIGDVNCVAADLEIDSDGGVVSGFASFFLLGVYTLSFKNIHATGWQDVLI
jgi:hypothetical protein